MATNSQPRSARHPLAMACRTRTDDHPDWQRSRPEQVIGPTHPRQARAHERGIFRTAVSYNDSLRQSPERGLLGDRALGAGSEFRMKLMGEWLPHHLRATRGPQP